MQKFILGGNKRAAFRSARRTHTTPLVALLVLFPLFGAAASAQMESGSANHSTRHSEPSDYVDNEACARCHRAIYDSYARTPMAHASGPANEDLKPADFVHARSGVHYRIFAQAGTAWLSFERPADPAVNGSRELLYFIGSGQRGRTYLFAVDGFFFESPINWYADRKVWDMAPAYGNAREIPLNLPAYASCLQCHASGVQPPVKGTENEYALPLFAKGGVGCERCHGSGEAHLTGGEILNPAKLPADRRDSVCMQCHLEGNVAIARAGRHAYEYRPGDILDDYTRHYVLAGDRASGIGANSQFEALAQSACKKKSGNAMSCLSCHDPHYSPPAAERASYFRAKCLACHGSALGFRHHPEKPDCTTCHMPSSLSTDIAHTEVTDHHIPRRLGALPSLLQDPHAPGSSLSLIPFPYSKEAQDDIRDLALAWQSLAESGIPQAAAQADRFLSQAVKQSPDDPAILSGLAYVELSRGAVDHARQLYQKALSLDPTLIDAATNLGVIEARSGNLRTAVTLWQGAFERAPGRSSIGMNLARTLCETGQWQDARSYVARVLRFNPDLSEARKLLQHLNGYPPGCGS